MKVLICLDSIAFEALALAHCNIDLSDECQAGKEASRVPCGRIDTTSPSIALCYNPLARPFIGPVSREWHDRSAECWCPAVMLHVCQGHGGSNRTAVHTIVDLDGCCCQ